ncbi:MAG TPA: SCP2 sterol-binding domain-containing protein [Steroidobacteraceae bacterium]|nr:SCP2 sterol-binding domain-containing protein [Steroidobacteraceae bacterium]
MPATAAWLASAEALLNRCIDSSAQAGALARRLQGTSLQIDVEGITRIRAVAHQGRLALLTGAEGSADGGAVDSAQADATISGSPPALLQLLKAGTNPEPRSAAGGRPAQIRGNAEIANQYRELFMLARPDPEEELSRWIGDIPARRLSEIARHTLEWARRARRAAGENIAEYLQEESRDLVNKTELEEFLRGVDELRETFDRIEVRLGRLEARLKEPV